MKKFIILFSSIYIFMASSVSAVVFAPALLAALGPAVAVLLPVITQIAVETTYDITKDIHFVMRGKCPAFCRGMSLACKTASGLSTCKGLCQEVERVGYYEIKSRFKETTTDADGNEHPGWNLIKCVRQRNYNSSKNTPQGKGDYNLELMDRLPKDRKGKDSPERQTIYLQKKADYEDGNYLEYTVIDRKGKSVTKTLKTITIKEPLTLETLKIKYKYKILAEIIDNGDIDNWRSIAVYNKKQREDLLSLISLETMARHIVDAEAMQVKPEDLNAALSKISDMNPGGLKTEKEKREQLVAYAERAIFDIQSAIEAKRSEYGNQ